jgi:hypothetical protein
VLRTVSAAEWWDIQYETLEPTIDALHHAPCNLCCRTNGNVHKIMMDTLTAKAMLASYDAIASGGGKSNFERCLADGTNFARLISFCLKRSGTATQDNAGWYSKVRASLSRAWTNRL